MVKCCCKQHCKVKGGVCNTHHQCFGCKKHMHAICGYPRYDENGDEIDDIRWGRICNACFNCSSAAEASVEDGSNNNNDNDEANTNNNIQEIENRNNKLNSKKISSTEDKNGNQKSNSNNEDDVLYSEEEYDKYKPGWFISTDVDDDQDILQLFSEPRVGTTVKLVGKILHIPAAYWSNDLHEHEFWREDGYDEGYSLLYFF